MKWEMTDWKQIAQYCRQREQSCSGFAGNAKGKIKADYEGQARAFKEVAEMIEKGDFVLLQKTSQATDKAQVQEVRIVNEDKKTGERPSAANNDFLRWVRQNYSVRIYQGACKQIEDGFKEEEVRRLLSQETC